MGRKLLGWAPRHDLKSTLPKMIAALKRDPVAWYEANGMTPPPAVTEAAETGHNSEALRVENEALYRREHAESRWAHFINMALGTWLMVQAPLIQLNEPLLGWTEFVLGALGGVFGAPSLSWQMNFARWA